MWVRVETPQKKQKNNPAALETWWDKKKENKRWHV
jgi:hypothetical protein